MFEKHTNNNQHLFEKRKPAKYVLRVSNKR